MSNKKPRRGRPPKAPKDRKVPYSVRFTPIELRQVEELAKAVALEPSIYVHHRALRLI